MDDESGDNVVPGLPVQSSLYQSPMYQYGSSMIILTNPEDEMFKLELSLRGLIQDREGKLQKLGQPLLNEQGIAIILGQVQSIVNRVTVMSNLEKTHIPCLIDFLADTLCKDLMINRRYYDIENLAARDKIFFMVLTTAFICMRRAFEGDDKKFWKGSVQEIRSSIETTGKKGILDNLMKWGGK